MTDAQRAVTHAALAALEAQPDSPTALEAAARELLRDGQLAHALILLEKAVRLAPASIEAWTLLGRLHYARGRYEDALACFERAQRLGAADAQIAMCLATSLHSLRRVDAAEPYFRRALAAEPNNLAYRWEYAMQLLLVQRFDPGWDCYEARLTLHGSRGLHLYPFPFPQWRGEALAGKTLLIHGEQGLGDEIMYCSIVPELIREAARVVIACSPALVGLFRRSFIGAQVVAHPRGNPDGWVQQPPACLNEIGRADFQIAMGSLPAIRRRTAQSFAGAKPYLTADPARAARMRELLVARDPSPQLRVGLVWSGNLATGLMGSRKSIPIRELLPFAQFRNVQWVGLHLADHAKESLELPELKIVDLSAELRDFDDTAALIANFDLVISVDTSVAHLAGAMGKPTWVPLWWAADWRWGWQKPRSYWYADTHLFHQRQSGDWTPVIAQMTERVRALLDPIERKFPAMIEAERRGDWALALAAYRAVPKDHPRYADAFWGTLRCLSWLERLPESLQVLFEGRANGIAVGAMWLARAADVSCELGGEHVAEARRYIEEALPLIARLAAAEPNSPYRYDVDYFAFKALFRLQDDRAWAFWRIRLQQYGKYLTRECYPEGTAQWNGESLQGKTILLHAEGGYGDEILFASMLDEVIDAARHVHLAVSPDLADLFRASFPRATVHAIERFKSDEYRRINELDWFKQIRRSVDVHAHLGDLPVFTRRSTASGGRERYLRVPATRQAKFANFADDVAIRVGICWSCDARKHPYEKRRKNIPIDGLAALEVPDGARLYSLYDKGRSEEIASAPARLRMVDTSPMIDDFADTAALIERLDLVITVDTAVAHLAGALGKPVLLLLSRYHDWRWQMADTSIWYPSMRIVRQKAFDDWDSVIAQVNAWLSSSCAAGGIGRR